jgi:ADP-ribose pyrophosphatase YjhB (NUDIX family)
MTLEAIMGPWGEVASLGQLPKSAQPISVHTAVVDHGQVLIQISRNPVGGPFCLPGGRALPSESLRDAARRTVLADTGILLKAVRLLCISQQLRKSDPKQGGNDIGEMHLYFVSAPPEELDVHAPAVLAAMRAGSKWVRLEDLDRESFIDSWLPARLRDAAQESDSDVLVDGP